MKRIQSRKWIGAGHEPLKPRGMGWRATIAFMGAALVFSPAALFFPAPLFSPAMAQEPAWQQVLRAQLLSEQNCAVNFLTNIFDGQLLGQQTLSARAHCLDGRRFDVKRERTHEPFTIKQCAPTYC